MASTWEAPGFPPAESPDSHGTLPKVPVYERAGVRGFWLVDPFECTLTIYQLEAGCYGHPTVFGLKGQTQLTAVPGVTIDWGRVLTRMSYGELRRGRLRPRAEVGRKEAHAGAPRLLALGKKPEA